MARLFSLEAGHGSRLGSMCDARYPNVWLDVAVMSLVPGSCIMLDKRTIREERRGRTDTQRLSVVTDGLENTRHSYLWLFGDLGDEQESLRIKLVSSRKGA